MRFLPISLLALALHSGSAVAAESIRILLQNSPLAGSQYYAVSASWTDIRVGDRLTLIREPDNRHDRHAIRVEWNGHKLGYVPRAENKAAARAMDGGENLEARVTRLRDDPDPWRRVEFAVYLTL
jgi:hypothetical protein